MRASKIQNFKMKQKTNLVSEEFYSVFYVIHNYYMFSNIDNYKSRN